MLGVACHRPDDLCEEGFVMVSDHSSKGRARSGSVVKFFSLNAQSITRDLDDCGHRSHPRAIGQSRTDDAFAPDDGDFD